MNIRHRIYLRTLWFFARNWFIPFLLGAITVTLVESNFAYQLAVAIDNVYSAEHECVQ